jgi:hypothetical protein
LPSTEAAFLAAAPDKPAPSCWHKHPSICGNPVIEKQHLTVSLNWKSREWGDGRDVEEWQVDVEDPREQIIAEFNKQGEQFGLTATVA